jgi:hypothetical protein
MKQGAGAAAAVFGGVLVLAGGVGWLLYAAGKDVEESAVEGGARKAPPKKGRDAVRFVEPAKVGPTKPKPPSTPDVRFPIPGHDDLKMRNWREVAIAFTEMTELSQEFWKNGPPDPNSPADAKRTERMNAVTDRYRTYVIESPEGFGVPPPDQDPNEAKPLPMLTPVDHPAFIVNLVAVLLDRAGAPLTEEQGKRMLEAGRKHSEIRDQPPPQTPYEYRLEEILAHGKMADDFFADVFSILSTKQAEIVSPAAYRGHAGMDPIGAGTTWSPVLRAMPFSDIDKLVDEIAGIFASSFNMPERAADLRPIVDKWARRISIDSGDQQEITSGAVRTVRGQNAVRDMIDLLQHVATDLDPPPTDMTRVRGVPVALVPLRK